ncbi:TRAP transporter fused permease subunit [Alsobacter sp. SYSU M60028]|uniref:TRAP transporter fused permease subunit n=1 Tax=Alsobacter ponti TaxID=2962936 RepID=A0ABT1LF29_9HYPH|nr:TRAP transporter fused permease subunit [Alsobacter ponti]MCP8939733.1 TRAP transporter fused permease subunit [Alsobacter ponti]
MSQSPVNIDLAGHAVSGHPDTAPVDPEHGLPAGFGAGLPGTLLFWIAVAFGMFQIVTAFGIPIDKNFVPGVDILLLMRLAVLGLLGRAVFVAARGGSLAAGLAMVVPLAVGVEILARFGGGLPSQVLRTVHVGFLVFIAGALFANHRLAGPGAKALGWLLGLAGFGVGLYQWFYYIDLVNRAGDLTTLDLGVGIAGIALLFVACWAYLGPALPIVAATFLAYTLFGHLLPAPLNHRGYDLAQIVEHMAYGTEGIYSTPTAVSATFIFLFILFGAFMERAGVIDFFNDISMAVFGDKQGGPGKVCVASSALMGTVSGSGVANVVASGQFTIPLMKRAGFSAAFAGGVEATSSMGGQIMPPVMGAVAFIMAETIDVPYSKIVEAAIIPALLYFGACYWAVHLEAGRKGLHGLPRDQLPNARALLREKWFLVAPLLVLVALLFGGYTPLFAGAVGLALTAAMMMATAVATGLSRQAVRLAFWIGFALLTAWSMTVSVAAVLAVVALLVLANLPRREGRAMLASCVEAMADGARQALPVGLACALVGIVIGTMTLTGVGSIFGNWLVGIGKESIIAALVMTMIFSLILGMGIPTIPNYIITSSLAAPILLKLDVPLIVSHMFVFYFGIMADLTPPVALAAFAAAPMAKESGMKIGFAAVGIALPGFIVPYMAVYDPQLMLQPVAGLAGLSYWGAVAWVAAKAWVAVGLWGIAAVGHWRRPWPAWARGLATAAAFLLVVPGVWADIAGYALGAAVLWLMLRGTPRAASPA